jgi:hypothetical protein
MYIFFYIGCFFMSLSNNFLNFLHFLQLHQIAALEYHHYLVQF